jgi:hypothetical protein
MKAARLRNSARLMRAAPLWRQLCGLVDALVEETMDKSKIVDHTVDVIIDRLEPLDENAGHCQAEFGARFSIMAHLPIEGSRCARSRASATLQSSMLASSSYVIQI